MSVGSSLPPPLGGSRARTSVTSLTRRAVRVTLACMRGLLVSSILVVAACGAAPPRAREAPALEIACAIDGDADYGEWVEPETCGEGEAIEVARFVIHAAIANERVEGYDAIWAPDAVGRTSGRYREPDECDLTLEPSAALAARRMEQEGADLDSLEMGLSFLEGRLQGGNATARAIVELRWGSGEDSASEEHVYRLRRTPEGWRVEAVRVRPLHWAIPDGQAIYDAAFWRAADAHVARARGALDERPDDLDAQRAYAYALVGASCLRPAYDVVRRVTEGPLVHRGDWALRERVAMALGLADDAALSGERRRTARLAEPDGAVIQCWPAEPCEEDDCDEGEDCAAEVLARIDTGDVPPRSVALLHERRGPEEQESTHLAVGFDGEWRLSARVADGPFNGNQTSGTLRIEVGELRFVQLVAGGADEVTFTYRSEEMEEDEDVRERGIFACVDVFQRPRCARFPEEVARGEPARVARARVTFPGDGTVRVERLQGRDPRVVVGARAIAPVESDE